MGSICYLGWGLVGYATKRLKNEFLPQASILNITGIDLSLVAINQAKAIHPDIDFIQSNLATKKLDHSKFDLICTKDVL